MTVGCRIKTEAYNSLDAWKAQLGCKSANRRVISRMSRKLISKATAAVIAAIAALQKTVKSRRAEKYKAEDLTEVVLRRLQDQVSYRFLHIQHEA